MFSKIWIINFTLLLLAVFFGVKAYGIWFEREKTGLEAVGAGGPETGIEIGVVKRGISPESAYEIIVQKDLFIPERTGVLPEGSVLEKKVGSKLTVHGKKVVLYGVVITDSCEMALISNPGAGKGEKGTVWIKADETIGGLKVPGIKEDRLFVTEGGRD